MANVIVVSPHPDDETLGCGGTLLKHKRKGDDLSWVIMTEARTEYGYSEERERSRRREISLVAEAYGFRDVRSLGLRPASLDAMALSEIIERMSTIFKELRPEVVYLPFPGDAHSDHATTFHAASACVKPFRYPSVQSVRIYETLSETDFGIDPSGRAFNPNLFVDISDFVDRKVEIMKLYEGEILAAPFPRSEETIRAQATVRGAVTGTLAAEAFMQVRELL